MAIFNSKLLVYQSLATTYTAFSRRRSSSAPSDRTSLSSSALLCKEPWTKIHGEKIYTTENHPKKRENHGPNVGYLEHEKRWVHKQSGYFRWLNMILEQIQSIKMRNQSWGHIWKFPDGKSPFSKATVTIPVQPTTVVAADEPCSHISLLGLMIILSLQRCCWMLLVYIKQHPDILLHRCCDFYFWVTLQGMLLLNINARARCTRCTLLPERVYSSFLHVKQFVSPSPTRRRYKAWVNAGTDNSDNQEDFWKRLQLPMTAMTLLSCASMIRAKVSTYLLKKLATGQQGETDEPQITRNIKKHLKLPSGKLT